jgi:translation initiation factor 5
MKSFLARNGISPFGEDADSRKRIAEELGVSQLIANLRPADRILIYIGTVMSAAVVSGKEIEKCSDMLSALAKTPETQRYMIAAFEWFCGTVHPTLKSKFPLVLKFLFDGEIVDEVVFLEWYADYAHNDYSADGSLITYEVLEELKQTAGPFITWLREADEEGDEDDEDEEEEEEEEEDEEA